MQRQKALTGILTNILIID